MKNKNHMKVTVPALLFCLIMLVQLSGCGGGSGGGGGGTEDTFTNGGTTLTTSVTGTTDTKTVTVADANSTNVLTLNVTATGLTMSAPGQTDANMTFRTPLATPPSDYCARRMAVYVAGRLATNTDISARPDSPGCDWFPDTQCTLGCCADHDKCYLDNSCGASSWIWGFGSDACKNCNNIAYDCIGAACANVTESFTANNCYDARCNKNYDCPPEYNNCTCKDICADSSITVPDTCGNGQCITGENLDNCWNDCGFGTSESACCAAHSFPGETGSSCGAGVTPPCCCGQDYACGWHVSGSPVPNICVGSSD
ncbi:MAG: hypothetical protein WC956_03245 [bacterium]